jgi:hypothetical protein
MSWASRRQFQYIGGIALFFAIIAFIILYPIITRKPTCFDGKRNGTETGVDCGGICSRVCEASASEPTVLWQRAFNVSGSNYNLVAYVENQNKNAGVKYISYEFRVYDTDNILIGRRQGYTYIPPNQQFAIFEPRFDAGKSEVKSVRFEFTSPFIWTKIAPTLALLPIKVDNVILSDIDTSPSMTARINNESVYDLPAFDVITILYDKDKIAVNVSKTHKDGLKSNTSEPLLFTWPSSFPEVPATKDLLVQINPFTVSF